MVDFTLDKVNELLKQLKGLPKIKEISQLRKRLRKEKAKLVTPVAVKVVKQVADAKALANIQRSLKQKRNWRYAKLIFNFVGDKFTLQEIRQEIAKKKRGNASRIPDAVFQNPSP